MPNPQSIDARLVLLSPGDNCLIACTHLAAGTAVQLEGGTVVLAKDIGLGHKLARHAIAAGEKVLKYGAVIGSLRAPVAAGEHIHTHNLDSDYTPTYTLDEGKTFVGHA
ncbi:UxaA family hydrolase [Variovorax paradoxus]|uniref:UxaA family hydrolase n=1 Tax=Variovorax paradoxus TaxID=34073 RepID=UPI0021AD1D7D|nr:UxaA family hydrolase [Variovorax paradoxus]UVH57603.1 UxaA family hydrolase [Variovorax paradoxus]